MEQEQRYREHKDRRGLHQHLSRSPRLVRCAATGLVGVSGLYGCAAGLAISRSPLATPTELVLSPILAAVSLLCAVGAVAVMYLLLTSAPQRRRVVTTNDGNWAVVTSPLNLTRISSRSLSDGTREASLARRVARLTRQSPMMTRAEAVEAASLLERIYEHSRIRSSRRHDALLPERAWSALRTAVLELEQRVSSTAPADR